MTPARPGQPVPLHRLRPNHRQWTPANLLCFDTETTWQPAGKDELHQLRCWTARLDVRRSRAEGGTGTVRNWGITAAQLADQITAWCGNQPAVWAYAHNLSFDLAVTQLPLALECLGWEVTAHSIGTETPWIRMKRGRTVLTLADSWGWLRAPLEQISMDVGITKPDLPAGDDSIAAWIARCEADTEILAAAMLQLMAWWDREKLGNWALTGSAGGWNAMRHMKLPEFPMIDGDIERARGEITAASYGGLRYAWRHGQLAGQRYTNLDFRRAYTVIARDHPLPVRRIGAFEQLDISSSWVGGQRCGIVAQCQIATDKPWYPVRAGGRIIHPVGRFATVLAGPEIAEARRRGHLVSIGAGTVHQLSPWLAPWARWVLKCQEDTSGRTPLVAKRACKHWGRSVIGKFGAHGYASWPDGPPQHGGWWHQPVVDAASGQTGAITEICGKRELTLPSGLGDNAYPAVLSFVESWCRVYLTRAIEAIGQDHVVTADTDGLITSRPDWETALKQADLGPLTMREKGTYREITVWGPQHLTAPGLRKLSGIPASAVPDEDGLMSALLWPKLAWQMTSNRGGGYLRPRQSYRLHASYITGWVLTTGDVVPLEAATCPDDGLHILPWHTSRPLPPGADLAPQQAAHLDDLITPPPEEGPCPEHHTSRSNGTATALSPSAPTPSCASDPNPELPKAARRGTWRRIGSLLRRQGCRGSSGRIRTS